MQSTASLLTPSWRVLSPNPSLRIALFGISTTTTRYLDHRGDMDIPMKLQAWAQHRAQPYLARHAVASFQVNPKRTSWKDYSRLNSLPHPWAEVGPKQKQKPKQRSKLLVNP